MAARFRLVNYYNFPDQAWVLNGVNGKIIYTVHCHAFDCQRNGVFLGVCAQPIIISQLDDVYFISGDLNMLIVVSHAIHDVQDWKKINDFAWILVCMFVIKKWKRIRTNMLGPARTVWSSQGQTPERSSSRSRFMRCAMLPISYSTDFDLNWIRVIRVIRYVWSF